MSHSKSEEIDRNLERFLEVLPSLVNDHEGQYALIRHGRILEFFDSAMDAQIAGNQRFDDKIFSIQRVRETAEEDTERKSVTLLRITVRYLKALSKKGTYGPDVAGVMTRLIEQGIREALEKGHIPHFPNDD